MEGFPFDVIGIVAMSAIITFLGVGIARVGVYGQFLGALRLVSNVQRYPDPPRLHHRWITVGLGATCVLLGVLLGIAGLAIAFLPDTV